MRIIICSLFMLTFFQGCQIRQVFKEEVVRDYIRALDKSDYQEVIDLFGDSIRLKELSYESVYSKEAYYDLFQWDSVFQPMYQLTNIEIRDGYYIADVLKKGKRIEFLNGGSVITREKYVITDDKIASVEITEYLSFNEKRWSQKRAELLEWVAKEYPGQQSFIHDQTRDGAITYLEMIEGFKKSQSPGE